MKLNFSPKLQYGLDVLSGISAGSGLIGGIIDAVTANSRMKEAEGFSDKQAQQQRNWAVEDRDWQANYNSPVNIMARYKAAGLNPNLIYGNNGFQAPATRSTPAAQPYVATPTMGKAIGDTLSNYQDMAMKRAQTENAQQMLLNLQQENISKQADIVRKNMENVILATDPRTNIAEQEDFRDIERAAIINRGEKLAQDTLRSQYAQEREYQGLISDTRNNAIGAALQESTIQAGMAKAVQTMQEAYQAFPLKLKILNAVLDRTLKDVDLKQLDIDMQNGGLNAKSPFYQKILSGLIDGVMMYMGGKAFGLGQGGFPSAPTQRPQFNPGNGVRPPGGTYRPPNSGMPNSALYNRSDLYNK